MKAILSKSGATLTIITDGEEKYYAVDRLEPDPRVTRRAYRLRFDTADGPMGSYDVHEGDFGPECECKGFLDRGQCRHILALQQVGLLGGKG